MAKSKIKMGCPEPSCKSHKKKKKYKATDETCPVCGTQLIHVCANKKCAREVDDSSRVLCALHEAKQVDKNAKANRAVGVGAAAGMAAGFVWKNRAAIKEIAKQGADIAKQLVR